MQSKRIALLSLFVVLASLSLPAQLPPDVQAKVADAIRQHRNDLATDIICNAAKQDPSLQPTCTSNRAAVDQQLTKFEQKYNEGVKAVQEGRFDDARLAFKNIYFGDYRDRAQDYLNNRIPALEQQAKSNQQAADNAKKQDADDSQNLIDGMAAFESGDLDRAAIALRKVQGSKKGDAQGILSKISQYQSAMNEGQQAENQKNYELARQKYSLAASIKSNGPGNPNAKLQAMDNLIRQTQDAGNRQQNAQQKAVEQARQQPPKPDAREIQRRLNEANRLKASGNTKEARKIYVEVLQADPGNAQANAALDELSKKGGSSDLDSMLADGIRSFYNGAYPDAEESLKLYMFSKGNKVGLAKFYRGAAKLSRYYLDSKPDQSLYDDAVQEFKDAKKVNGFTPPSEKYVSPKILKVYEQAS